MNANLIFQLVELAIALAQSQLDPGDAGSVLLGIVQRGVSAYKAATGKPLDPSLITPEAPV